MRRCTFQNINRQKMFSPVSLTFAIIQREEAKQRESARALSLVYVRIYACTHSHTYTFTHIHSTYTHTGVPAGEGRHGAEEPGDERTHVN